MVVDAHVHLLPDRLRKAIYAWFDANAWHIVYDEPAEATIRRMRAGGIDRMVALPYAHRPGMSESLNAYTARLAADHPEVIPCATVFPGEEGEEQILDEALGRLACAGIKIHCHVMKMGPDDPRMEGVWRAAARHRRPLVIHAGREPATPGYGLDVHTVSGAERMRRALDRHPDVEVVVPHLGGDEFEPFERLLEEYPRLYLDTAMVIAGYFPSGPDLGLLKRHPDRILYGTDSPNLPYEWSKELSVIQGLGLASEEEARILGGNALRLFSSSPTSP